MNEMANNSAPPSETPADYPPPVSQLLTLGDPSGMLAWPDYLALSLTLDHVPDLIRMALDEELQWADSESDEVWAPLHAWRTLAQLRAEAAVEPLVGLLGRLDEFEDDWTSEELPQVFGYIGQAAIAPLAQFLADPEQHLWARIAAAHAFAEIGQRQPTLRDQGVAGLTQQLEQSRPFVPTKTERTNSMSDNLNSEAALELETIALLRQLGWESVNAYDETFALRLGSGQALRQAQDAGPSGTLGREHRGEVVLLPRLRAALAQINPDLPAEALALAVEELTRDRSAMSLVQANREIYQALKDGLKVAFRDEDNEEQLATVRLIDWQTPENNDFLLVSQLWVAGDIYTRRTDLVGFVNGLPLLFIELKASHRRLVNAFRGNFHDYQQTIPHLFWTNGLVILSNGRESRVGSVTTAWEHFGEWKRINDEGETGVISLETTLRATCSPVRLLDLVENFTVFAETKGGVKEGEQPVKDKQALLEALVEAMGEMTGFCQDQGVDLDRILAATSVFQRLALEEEALDALLVNDEAKQTFLTLVGNVDRIYRAILPDPLASQYQPVRRLLIVLAETIRSLAPEIDISGVMGGVETLLDRSIAPQGYVIQSGVVETRTGYTPISTPHRVDLSQIDLGALQTHFKHSQQRIEIEKLRGAINRKLQQMVRLNRQRMNTCSSSSR